MAIDDKKKGGDPDTQGGGITHKKDLNAGSGAFNQGSEQDPDFDKGVADGVPEPEKVSKEPQNPGTKLNEKGERAE